MFGARFDPNSFNDQPVVPKRNLIIRKRRLSNVSDEEVTEKVASDSESDSSSSSSSTSSSSSSSSDSSDSDSDSSDSDSDSSDSDSEEKPKSVESTSSTSDDKMEIDETIAEENGDDMEIDQEPVETTEPIENNQPLENNEPNENDPQYISKHESVFKKFNKSVQTPKKEDESEESEEEDIETQDLAPIPQPTLPRDKKLTSTSTHLKNLDWLTVPTYASPSDTKPFKDFPLSPFMLRNLENSGFSNAFSVQIAVMNILLKDLSQNKLQPDMKGDLLVNASTGSGKTLAYLIPIIESLHKRIVPRVRAIILVPTKPLISQVKATFIELSRGTNLSILSLKNDISIKDEGTRLLTNEPDVIISTPGRLVDHLINGSISLSALQYLVIDEADRLLNQSFQDWCRILISKLDHQVDISKQWKLSVKKLIFSATLTTDAGKLSALKFEKPRLVIVNDQEQLVNEIFTVPPTLSEYKIQFGSSKNTIKPLILAKFLISKEMLSNVIIFTKSNEASLRLSKLLELIFQKIGSSGIEVGYINSTNNKTSTRTKILKDFSTQKVNILVATDLIARGIDILSITDVINYDMPNSSREYVHRVGRTARANQSGKAYNLCFGKGEAKWFKTIVNEVGRGVKTVEELEIDSKAIVSREDEDIYNECLEELQKQVFSHV